MEKIIKLIVLTNMQVLISEIEEVSSDLGEPDCKLINPFVVINHKSSFDKILESFLSGYTNETVFMMSSDKILTLAEPSPSLLQKYKEIVK